MKCASPTVSSAPLRLKPQLPVLTIADLAAIHYEGSGRRNQSLVTIFRVNRSDVDWDEAVIPDRLAERRLLTRVDVRTLDT